MSSYLWSTVNSSSVNLYPQEKPHVQCQRYNKDKLKACGKYLVISVNNDVACRLRNFTSSKFRNYSVPPTVLAQSLQGPIHSQPSLVTLVTMYFNSTDAMGDTRFGGSHATPFLTETTITFKILTIFRSCGTNLYETVEDSLTGGRI